MTFCRCLFSPPFLIGIKLSPPSQRTRLHLFRVPAPGTPANIDLLYATTLVRISAMICITRLTFLIRGLKLQVAVIYVILAFSNERAVWVECRPIRRK